MYSRLVLLMSLAFFGLSAQGAKQVELLLEGVANSSAAGIYIAQKEHYAQIEPRCGRCCFKQSFTIPFISIAHYIREYTKSIAQNRAYIPRGALRIRIGTKQFGLWEHEAGIVYSADPKTAGDDDNGPQKLLDGVNRPGAKPQEKLMSVLKLLLLIDEKSNVSLEIINKP